MKKTVLLFAAAMLIGGGCSATREINVLSKIKDRRFRTHCRNAMNNEQGFNVLPDGGYTNPAWDTDGNGRLSPAEAAAVKYIDFHTPLFHEGHEGATSLAGIEYFTGLTHLVCDNSELTSLDLRDNTQLIFLNCSGNNLTSLDISKNNKLTVLYCRYNLLTSLDISQNTALTDFSCEGNPGDGVSVFPVTAWFDNDSVPPIFSKGEIHHTGLTNIAVDYKKSEERE